MQHGGIKGNGVTGGEFDRYRPGQGSICQFIRLVQHLLFGRAVGALVAPRYDPEGSIVVEGEVPRQMARGIGLAVGLQTAQGQGGSGAEIAVELKAFFQLARRLGEQRRAIESGAFGAHELAIHSQ